MPIVDLGLKAVRGIIRAAMPNMYRAGMSANRALRWSKDVLGGAYRRKVFLDDWRKMTSELRTAPLLAPIGMDDRISGDALTSVFMTRPRKYRWIGMVTYRDELTGQTWDAWASGYSNADPYKSVFLSEYQMEIDRAEQYPNRQVLQIDFRSVLSNRNFGL